MSGNMADINMEQFHLLTRITGELPQRCDKGTVQSLIQVVQQNDAAALEFTKPYLFTQISKILINPEHYEKHDLKLELVNCLLIFIERTPPDILNQNNIFVALTSILGKDFAPSEIPEELKIATLKCMTKLSSSTSMIAKEKLYVKINTPLLGKSIFLASQIARRDSYAKVRIAALEFILEICQLSQVFEKKLIFRQQIADVVMFFLPGIVSAIQEIALGTVTQNHAVTEIAIEIWGRLLALVMEDVDVDDASPENIDQRILNLMKTIENIDEVKEESSTDWRKDGKEGLMKHLEKSQRNSDWFSKTANKIVTLMPFIKSLCLNDHFLVRKKLLIACNLILMKAFCNMKPCVPFLVEILLILSQDSYDEICELSNKCVNNFIGRHGINIFSHIVEETYHNQISELPSLIMHSNEDQLTIGLNSILGTLKIFKNDDLFNSETNERLVDALTTVVEIDVQNVSLAESYSKKIFDLTEAKSDIPFKRITDLQGVVLQKIKRICSKIGYSKDSETVCDMLFNRMQNGPHRLESTLLLNYVLETLSENTGNIKCAILRYLYYDNVWYLPITTRPRKSKLDDYKSQYYSDYTPGLYEGALEVRFTDIDDVANDDEEFVNDSDEYCATVNEARFNIMLMSLQTEAVGIFAENMGEKFRPHFFKFLYLVLERYRHESLVLQNAAMLTVDKLMTFSNVKTFSELIDSNSDYLIYNVQMKLGHISRYSFDHSNAGVLNVVSLIIENCTKLECLQYFIEIIDNVQPFDFKNDVVVNSLLNVFLAFVENVSKLVSRPNRTENVKKEKLNLYEKMEKLLKNLDESRKLQEKINEYVNDDGDNNDDDMEVNYQEETKPDLPNYVDISSKVIRYCLNILNSNSEKHKLKALEVINVGVVILSDYEDALLPIIHEIWSPLFRKMQSINEDKFRLLIQAFKILCTLADLGKDFIRQRAAQNVLPVIFNYLKEAANLYKKVKPVDYKFTQAFKFQFEILNNLGKLSNDLKISEKDKLFVMVAAAQYLSYDNPQELQTAARKLYLDLFTTDKYGVVYFLAHVWPIKMFENNSDIDCIFDEKCKMNVLLLEEAMEREIH